MINARQRSAAGRGASRREREKGRKGEGKDEREQAYVREQE